MLNNFFVCFVFAVKTGEDCITQRTVTGEKIKKKKKFLKVKIEALENKEIEKKKKVLKKMRPDMKVKVKKERKPKNGDKDSDDDNDEDCSATKCLRPVGELSGQNDYLYALNVTNACSENAGIFF